MTQLIVADLEIRQDEEGRYCLNDLHKAAGGDTNKQPAYWYRNDQFKSLLEELSNSANLQTSPYETYMGRYGGTFVVKELVYAYAMWISPKFQLKVIRAFDQLQTQGIAVAEHAAEDLLSNPMAYMEKVFQQAKVLKVLTKKVTQQNMTTSKRI